MSAPTSSSEASAAEHGSESVLVIDDNPADIRLLSQMLRPQGLRIFAALSGADGIKRAMEQAPSLVLLDMGMQDLDGQATCRVFKSTPQLRDIPIIFLTASGLIDDKLRAFGAGAVDYITKPFSAQEVAARVRVHMRLRQISEIAPLDAPPAQGPDVQASAPPATMLAPTAPGPSVGLGMVRLAQKQLLEDLSADVSLADLARAVGTNERKLTEEFRRHTGMAVFEYLRQERHRLACKLLLLGDAQISQIAARTGFQSVAAFSFAFRKYCGLTPSQYRQTAGVSGSDEVGG